jgi:SAM-dependent methyltransferase
VRTVRRAWQEFGAIEPYYSVLTKPQYLRENLTEDALNAFFASGEEEINNLFSDVGAHFDVRPPLSSALDFGCGVARLTIPLARRAERVFAVDVADAMLERAREHCRRADAHNVTFLALDHLNSIPRGSIDLVCAHLVLQHIPRSSGRRLLGHLAALLAPRGLLSIDFPIHCSDSRLRAGARWLRAHSRLVHAAACALKRQPRLPYMQMNTYDLSSVLRVLGDAAPTCSVVNVSRTDPFLIARVLAHRLA